ncbi:MAG: hypothetical protein F4Y78_01465 [Candidatus Dadabacteria bacterium]|nr:hypothetical protein [Candidatus Dadabacteria bacterium]MYA48383.1 hypothetical protein [Candidatus Dadabacteria bacterium]MYF48433.1 hypothetical protein [Candidatus Dadabacteria bacterium]MYG82708.1 hypothetical protein [Candidatus Dadabacteria bacterium]MYK49262.1 hypothetical protein [Candidatus Dadabacteria bacterium]
MSRKKQDKVSFYKFFQQFPDETSAEKYFAEKRWGKNGKDKVISALRGIQDGKDKGQNAVSLQGLPQAFQRKDWKHTGGKQYPPSQVAYGHLSAQYLS